MGFYQLFNIEIATRLGPWPKLSCLLTDEELEELWFFYVLEFGHVLDLPLRAVSTRP